MAKTRVRTSTKSRAAAPDIDEVDSASAPEAPVRAPQGPKAHAGHRIVEANRPTPAHVQAARKASRRPAAPVVEDEPEPADGDWPQTRYRKAEVTKKFPNGYEAIQVDEVKAKKLDPKVWKKTPEGMTPDVPHGHEE